MDQDKPGQGPEIFAALSELAAEVGAEFRGIDNGALVFAVKRTEDEASVRAMAETIIRLIMTSEDLKGLLKDYPRIALR